jgi:hypothetical protein
MSDHITEWLGAYHDGELHGARLRQAEQHLAGCAACRAELDELRNLSTRLQDTASMGGFLTTERFVANLALRLPRTSEQPQHLNPLTIGWWLIPVALLGIWLFIDITFSISPVITLAVDTGLLGDASAWLQGNPPQMQWFATALNLFGNQLGAPGLEILSALHDASLLIAQMAGRLIPHAILAVAYLGWLFSWWLRQQPPPSERAGGFLQS